MKKHILVVLPYLNQGGTEKQALSLIIGLRDRYKISLLAPDGKGAAQFRVLPILQEEFTRWDFNFFKGLPELISGIKKIQKEQAIDLVHIHAAHELMLPVRLILSKFLLSLRCMAITVIVQNLAINFHAGLVIG